MLKKIWIELPEDWKYLVYKHWLLFIRCDFPLNTFHWDDSHGLGFILCKVLGIESSNPEKDLRHLDELVCRGIRNPSINILDKFFSMQYLCISSSIYFLSPLKFFPNIKVVDFHCQNESKITDFEILRREHVVYVLDYADYQIIDFDKCSNIRNVDNIRYIKSLGFPNNINYILSELS